MCLGIPAQVISGNDFHALCDTRHGVRQIDLLLVGPQAAGTWLLCFLDAAREVIDADYAQRVNAALDGLEAVMAGTSDVSQHFADLIDRVPELPAHLREVAP